MVEIAQVIGTVLEIFVLMLVIGVLYIMISFFVKLAEKRLLRKAKTKKQVSNIEIFSRLVKYTLTLVVLVFAIAAYSGGFTGLGVTLGLFTASLGFALQRPVSGIAGWIMVVVKRPFEIGDRIVIGTTKGDVENITLTHIFLKEVGGLVPTEENSGRIVMVPNSVLFEQNIVNYTLEDDFVLDQIKFSVTYKSDLNKAIEIGEKSASRIIKGYGKNPMVPYARVAFEASGMAVFVRYRCPAKHVQKVQSEITHEVFNRVNKIKSVSFAFPHTQVILDKG